MGERFSFIFLTSCTSMLFLISEILCSKHFCFKYQDYVMSLCLQVICVNCQWIKNYRDTEIPVAYWCFQEIYFVVPRQTFCLIIVFIRIYFTYLNGYWSFSPKHGTKYILRCIYVGLQMSFIWGWYNIEYLKGET